MKIRTIIGAASAAIVVATAAPASAHDVGDKVTPNFDQVIPNIPGKSLIVLKSTILQGRPGSAYPRKIGLHLRLCHFRKDRVRKGE